MNRLTKRLAEAHLKPLILGMVHLQALPGAPLNKLNTTQIVDKALKEAEIYSNHKLDGIIVENMHDIPYVLPSSVGPETTAAMSSICYELRRSMPPDLPIGVQILAGCNREAMAVALAADLDFIRAECYVYSHIADEGLMNGCAGELMRYRSSINAQHVSVLTDVKKKHSSHILTSDISIEQTASDAEFFLSDGVIVTGNSTGVSASLEEVKRVKERVSVPVYIGSGITAQNLHHYKAADGLIIGSYFKHHGLWKNDIDVRRVKDLMKARDTLFTAV